MSNEIDSDIVTKVKFAEDQAAAFSQLSEAERDQVMAIVADHIHANGMYGHGTGAHLGGEQHVESIAKQVLADREAAQISAFNESFGEGPIAVRLAGHPRAGIK